MIGIVNYGAGNIFSLTSALERLNTCLTEWSIPKLIWKYTHIIIPGVGHAGAAMKKLEDTGLVEPIKALKKPVLGICVGMQLLTAHSEEGDATMMNIFPLQTRLFNKDQGLKFHTWDGITSITKTIPCLKVLKT
jgi:glutamine amidotransferase